MGYKSLEFSAAWPDVGKYRKTEGKLKEHIEFRVSGGGQQSACKRLQL